MQLCRLFTLYLQIELIVMENLQESTRMYITYKGDQNDRKLFFFYHLDNYVIFTSNVVSKKKRGNILSIIFNIII